MNNKDKLEAAFKLCTNSVHNLKKKPNDTDFYMVTINKQQKVIVINQSHLL